MNASPKILAQPSTSRMTLPEQIIGLLRELHTLEERIHGVTFTPKKFREERLKKWQEEKKQKVEEYNKLVDEFNASTSSQSSK